MHTKRQLALAVTLTLAGVASPALALDFPWSKIYDSSTPLPGTNLTPVFLSEPAISGDNFAFAAAYTADTFVYEGVYSIINGSLTRVADRSTPLPGSNFISDGVEPPAIHGSEVAFYSAGLRTITPGDTDRSHRGIYRSHNGALSLVASTDMNVPGAATPFHDFSGPDIRDGTVIFNGVNDDGNAAGVYTQTSGGPLHTVADLNTPVPGRAANFYGFPYTLAHTTLLPDGSPLFLGGYQEFGNLFGLYRTAGPTGPLQTVAEDSVTPIPGGGGTFLDVYSASVADDDGTIVFSGYDLDTRGIYALRDGTLQTIVDNSTLLPDGSRTFGSFGNFTYDAKFAYNNGVLLFEGYDRVTALNNTLHGLYVATLDGEVHKLLSPGQTFDGKTIQYWLLGRDSLHANGIGLTVHFTDGSTGIYTTSTAAIAIPEPAALSLLAAASLLTRRRRTARSQP
jgi:hypothetical protein